MPGTCTFIGAALAYLIGSGFASGQEIMQYFVPFGKNAIAAAGLTALILITANSGFAYAGEKCGDNKDAIFVFFAGPKAGKIFCWLTAAFALLSYVVMLAGAGSALNQQYGLPLWTGVAAMTIFTVITVCLGLNKLVNIISRIGPFLAALVLFTGIVTLLHNSSSLPENLQLINEGRIALLKSANKWWLSALLNGGMNLLIMSGLMAELGEEYGAKKIMAGQSIGVLLYASICLLMAFALISVLPQITGTQIPNLVLAAGLSPALAAVFGIIIFAAVFTTACPLLWTAASRINREKSRRYSLTVLLMAGSGSLLALAVPFATLVNRIFVAEGLVGIILFFFICRKLLLDFVKRKIKRIMKDNKDPW